MDQFLKPSPLFHSQAGLVSVLLSKFATTIFVTLSYLGLTVGFHVWMLTTRWDLKPSQVALVWTNGLTALYGVQKVASLAYYYFYKRTALKMSDPRYYEDGAWLREQLAARN